MQDEEKPKSELLRELEELRKQLAEAASRRAVTREDRLLLAMMDRVPFSVWACNRKYKIVLWTGSTPLIYERNKEGALGKNFLHLFVDEAEREEAKADVLRIIDEDIMFKNFLAYDRAADGTRRTMLTNCFRIWDEDNQEWLQAEVGVNIDDLNLRMDEHRTLRELGMAGLAQQKRILELEKRALILQVEGVNREGVFRIRELERELDDWAKRLLLEVSKEQAKKLAADHRADLLQRREDLRQHVDEWRSRIEDATTVDDLDPIKKELDDYESRSHGG